MVSQYLSQVVYILCITAGAGVCVNAAEKINVSALQNNGIFARSSHIRLIGHIPHYLRASLLSIYKTISYLFCYWYFSYDKFLTYKRLKNVFWFSFELWSDRKRKSLVSNGTKMLILKHKADVKCTSALVYNRLTYFWNNMLKIAIGLYWRLQINLE